MCFSNPTQPSFIAPNWTLLSHREGRCPNWFQMLFCGRADQWVSLYLRTSLKALARWGRIVLHRQLWCSRGDVFYRGGVGLQSHAGDNVCKWLPNLWPPHPSVYYVPVYLPLTFRAIAHVPFHCCKCHLGSTLVRPQAALYSPIFPRGLRLAFHVFSYLLGARQAFSSPFTLPCPWILSAYFRIHFPPPCFLYFPLIIWVVCVCLLKSRLTKSLWCSNVQRFDHKLDSFGILDHAIMNVVECKIFTSVQIITLWVMTMESYTIVPKVHIKATGLCCAIYN